MKKHAWVIAMLSAGAISGNQVLAEDEPEGATRGLEWKVTASEPTFRPDFSQRTRIGQDSSKLAFEIQSNRGRYFYFGGGAGLSKLDDFGRLNVRVESVDFPGVPRSARSDETAGSLSAYLGARYPFHRFFTGYLTVGYEDLNFRREINNCVDCPVQGVPIDAGAYYDVGLTFGDRWRFTLAKRTYGDTSDLEPHVVFSFGREN